MDILEYAFGIRREKENIDQLFNYFITLINKKAKQNKDSK